MKFLCLLLVSNIIICYSGLCNVCYSSNYTDITKTDCHKIHHYDEVDGSEKAANRYTNPKNVKGTNFRCQDALTNAPQLYNCDFKYILINSVAIDTFNIQIKKVSVRILNLTKIAYHSPPELFLSNSSFLL